MQKKVLTYFKAVSVKCIVYAAVWKDNPGDLSNGLSPLQTQNHKMTCSLRQHAFSIRALRDI